MTENRRRGGHRGGLSRNISSHHDSAYVHLRNPFTPQPGFSEDEIAAIHDTALRILENLGIRVLLDEGRDILKSGGALVDEEAMMVFIGREMVEAALATAPKSIRMRAANPMREQTFAPGSMLFEAGSGCPNAFDNIRGRRPGSLRDYCETLKLQQSFDVIHLHGPSAEPQDVAVNLRHYAIMRGQLTLGDKPVFVYARGRGQTLQSFEMIRQAHQIGEAEFENGVWATTVINSNSPRQLDIPMTRGIIDFARAGQMSIITPFCLAGAMAPVTISGALALQHAEALAGITLAQLTRSGAPVSHGGFTSNVDMKSGSPAFGTPEHIRACLGSGQLARLIGLPWRSASGAASNLADGQGVQETTMALWGAVLAQATLTLHAAGWLEGGLTFGYEKFILDVEALQSIAHLARPAPATADDIGYDSIAKVAPGGHFFDTEHTMSRYKDAFYQPLVADLRNHGAWTEAGALSADQRATGIWQEKLVAFIPPPTADGVDERLAQFIADETAKGGVAPED